MLKSDLPRAGPKRAPSHHTHITAHCMTEGTPEGSQDALGFSSEYTI